MVTTNEYFISQMKLRELREQRSRLLRVYDELLLNVSNKRTEVDRLRTLYEGLRQITFADQKLHPDVANLEPLLGRTDTEAVTLETLTFWRERLAKELTSGQLRSEIMYIFGALLEEWAANASETPESTARQKQLIAQQIEQISQPAQTGNYTSLLNTLFSELAFDDETERTEQMQKAVASHLPTRITPTELAAVLKHLSSSPYHSASIRKQAQSFVADAIMQKELADALTIMLEHLSEWRHPQAGIPPRALWTLNKWRLFVDEDLPEVCFLEIMGQRWNAIFQQFFHEERTNELKRLRRQGMSQQAEYTTQIALRINQSLRANSLSALLTWEQGALPQDEIPQWEYCSIFERRFMLKSELHDINKLSNYDALQSATGMEKALALINAEILLAQTAPTPTPLHILKLDLKDFYPSLSHEILLEILQRYGLSSSQLAFFREFLRIPIRHNEQVITSERGIPNYHQLSDILSELVLGLFEQHVQNTAKVQIFRLVDDICLLSNSASEMTKAWQAAQEFCEVFGLAFNMQKCGSASINAEQISGLPEARPRWLLLTLDQENRWSVDWRAFEEYLEGARLQVTQNTSLVSLIETYNIHLKYLIKALALRADLGEEHRQGINGAMERFYQAFFGPGQGIVESIRQTIRERFLGERSDTHIPEAWLCWPITAGGCGLIQANVLAAIYNANFSQRVQVDPPKERPDDWQYRNNAWSSFYQSLTNEISEDKPTTNQIMETLVKDFIRRGSEISNSKQEGLSAYWRWILYLYGPQILDSLGTFRFLITELVPLQLIMQKYREDSNDNE